MTTRRDYGEGNITPKGPNVWRLRYRANKGGKRLSATVRGTRADAQKELRRLLKSVDDHEHVEPTKLTLQAWVTEWIKLLNRGEAGGRRGLVSQRTSERYEELITSYAASLLTRPIQRIATGEIDAIYLGMEERGLSASTVRHLHVALRACLASALRKGKLAKNPTDNVDVPPPVEREDIGTALDAADLQRLIAGFAGSVYQIIIITAVLTGARLSEVLALRWTDFDPKAKTLRIERAIEMTKKYGKRLKEPKTKRGKRSIVLDDALVERLLAHRAMHLRIAAGIPDGIEDVDLSMIKLPADALLFPSPVCVDGFDFAKLRNPRTCTREIRERLRKLGFTIRSFQDYRVSHSTSLLDDGKAPHTVAARLGNSPEVLMRAYAKRTKKADASVAASLNALAAAVLK